MHDAFVFEAPLGGLDDVAVLTLKELTNAVTAFWPFLNPSADSIERWMEVLTYRF
jgi:hypothetical protein